MVLRNTVFIILYIIAIFYGNIVILYGTYTTYCLLIYYTYNTVGLRRISFFSEIRSPRSVTPFLTKRPLPPPQKNATAAQPLSACIACNLLSKKEKNGG